MAKYVNSKGEEVDVRTMATPHVLAAMAKAEREGKTDVRDMLFAEAGEREKPVWEVRQKKRDQVIRYAMQQTNAEAWKFVKQYGPLEDAEGYTNSFFVAHESDPL
jgi:hypothetical protein